MTDFVPIKDGIAAQKGTIRGIIISQSDLKSGTKDGKDWTRKVFTLEDGSGTILLTAWNHEIEQFKVGATYEIENPWWREHEGTVGISLGQYAKVHMIYGPSEKTTMSEKKPLPSTTAEIRETVNDTPENKKSLKPTLLSIDQQKVIKKLAIRRYEVRQQVEQDIKSVCGDANQGMITMIAEKVYNEMIKKEIFDNYE